MSRLGQLTPPNTKPAKLPSRVLAFFMLFITCVLGTGASVYTFMSIRALTSWELAQATVVEHKVTYGTNKKGKEVPSYRPIYEVTDASGNKARYTSRYGYGNTDKVNIGETASIRHNGRDTAILNSFGSLYAGPLFAWVITLIFGGFFWGLNHQLAKAGNPVFKLK